MLEVFLRIRNQIKVFLKTKERFRVTIKAHAFTITLTRRTEYCESLLSCKIMSRNIVVIAYIFWL